jgi:uncharacterized protein (TIGR01777 family)
MKTYLITGGSGLVGRRLSDILFQQGDRVKHLSRNPGEINNVEVFKWDIPQEYVDPKSFDGVDVIVHLAGAEIMEKRLDDDRKREIINSRVNSLKLLYSHLENHSHHVKCLISSSAQGYYQPNTGQVLKETNPPGPGFLGEVCKVWEEKAFEWEQLGIRVAVNRIGLVFAATGGAFTGMRTPIEKGFGSYFGNGKQIYPWIHIDDMCRIIIHEANNKEITGVYNAAAPYPVDQKEVIKVSAACLNKKAIPFPVPRFILKLLMGERAGLIMNSYHMSAEKIIQTGFAFEHPRIEGAITNLLK